MTGGKGFWKPTTKDRCFVTLLALGLAAGLFAPSAQANAEVTATDMQVAGRALSFMSEPLTGEIRLGIVYDPANQRSARQARDVEDMLGGGMRVGSVTLLPVMVPMGEMAASDVDLFFMTEYLGEGAGAISGAAEDRRIPCVTVDIPQVQRGVCVMGIRSAPRVEILVNRAAAAATGTSFATVFRMMITEF